MSALWVEITATRGSAPRDAGTAMKVTATGMEGTIGGGALEHAAIARARMALKAGRSEFSETVPLGPGLGQCCGGSVTLRYTGTALPTDRSEPPVLSQMQYDQPALPLWLWGAGHVGRAVVRAAPAGAFTVSWVDVAEDRFPGDVAPDVDRIIAADMPLLATRVPRDAHHLIFTFSHDIDLALCTALPRRGFASCGLIGSATKWTRFSSRIEKLGLDPAAITCPIGDKSRGKAPDQIAGGVIDALLTRQKAVA